MVETQSRIHTRPLNNGEILKHQTSLIYLNPSYGKQSDLWQQKWSMFPAKSCCLGLLELPFRPVAYGSARARCVPPVQFDPFMPFQLERNLAYTGECSRCCVVKDEKESQARTHSAQACSISSPFPFDLFFSHEYTSFLVAGVLS